VGSGPVLRNVEFNDDTLGFVVSNDLNPQKARVLLMLGLMTTSDPKKLQTIFDSY
jgi:L-asparaginase/Glu-tRNA(Gln) amidotransferase subunit D